MNRSIILFVGILICLPMLNMAQEPVEPVVVFNTLALIKPANADNFVASPLESKYLLGSVKYQLADSSLITPSGLAIKIFSVTKAKDETLLTVATTNAKGVFYLTKMSLGTYRITVSNRSEVVCERFFVLNNVKQNLLQPLLIPVNKIEEKVQQKQQYENF